MQRLALVLSLTLALLFTQVASRTVRAWGATGHHVIARLALELMTPDAKRQSIVLLGSEAEFVAQSTWADAVRRDHPETANWHFVSIPYSAQTYDPSRDCRSTDQGDCIIAALERARVGIADPALPVAARQDALKYLIHFIGDFHQPLHNIGNSDRGGNDVHVDAVEGIDLGGRSSNLHSVWDSLVIDHRGLDEAQYTAFLLKDLQARPAPEEAVDLVNWSLAAHTLAVQVSYAYAGFSDLGPPAAPVAIDAAYQARAQPVIDRQLELAGARLARVLSAAFQAKQ